MKAMLLFAALWLPSLVYGQGFQPTPNGGSRTSTAASTSSGGIVATYSIDFSAEATQAVTADGGITTSDGRVWAIGNPAQASVFSLTNGSGWNITTINSASNTINPAIRLPLANLISGYDARLYHVRVWLELTTLTMPNTNSWFRAGLTDALNTEGSGSQAYWQAVGGMRNNGAGNDELFTYVANINTGQDVTTGNTGDLVFIIDEVTPEHIYGWSAAGPGWPTEAQLHYRSTPLNLPLPPPTWAPTIEITTWAQATAIVLKKMKVDYILR